MSVRTRRKIRSALAITAPCVVVSVAWGLSTSGAPDAEPWAWLWWGPVIGILLGLPLALLEESGFAARLRRLPFSAALLGKTITYLSIVTAVFLGTAFMGGLLRGQTITDYLTYLRSADFRLQIGAAFLLYLVILFFRQVDRLLGPGILLRYVTGRYHRPKKERRVFMFLDLKSSTMIAEQLDEESYYSLVNDFFRDITEPVLDTSAEIYEYVGDEVVLAWTLEEGLSDANCLKVFFMIDDVIARKRDHYLRRYGLAPEYKAGVHSGDVIIAEIGDLNKQIVYNGDVLNTTARIHASCNRLGKRLLVSRALIDQLALPSDYAVEPLGAVELKGKADPVHLVALA